MSNTNHDPVAQIIGHEPSSFENATEQGEPTHHFSIACYVDATGVAPAQLADHLFDVLGRAADESGLTFEFAIHPEEDQ